MTGVNGLTPAQLSRLLEVGRTLVSNLDPESLLQQILEVASDLTDASYAALGILDADKRELERFLFRGIDEETRQRIGPLPRGHGILGELIRNPATLRLGQIGEHPRSYGFPAEHPPMTSFLGCPVKIRGEVFGNIYLTDKRSASEFQENDEQLLEVLAEWAAIAIDNARSHERVERRRGELERAVRGLRATTELSRELERETDLERVLELIVKRGRALAEARACLVLLIEDGHLEVAAAAGEIDDVVVGARVEVSGPQLEALHAGLGVGAHGSSVEALEPIGVEARSALLVPLRAAGSNFGVLVLLDRMGEDPAFDADDEVVLNSFGASAAGAIATTRAQQDEKLKLAIRASEQERQRWARELHDETLQELGALRIAQQTALAVDDPDAMRHAIAGATEQVERVILGLEAVITELRPAALDQLGVGAALEALVERIATRFGIEVTVDADLAYESGREAQRHAPDVEATIYRVVQEALTNVGKHAEATAARVAIDEREQRITITVEDDGKGLSSTRRGSGFGLVGMRERVGLLGGALTLGPGTNGGTRVVAALPIGHLDTTESAG